MRFAVLGSGSGGNATVVESGGTRLLVDAGLSAKQLVLRLRRIGIEPESLSGILLTHEHCDHVCGRRVHMKTLSVPVFATPSTSHVVRENLGPISWKLFESDSCFAVGDLEIQSFAVPHDAVEPVGFVFRREGRAIGLISDAGHVTKRVSDLLSGVQAPFIEANYDDELLEADTKRPWSTKQRISSRHGHLSNAQTAALVAELIPAGLRRVVLGHLSKDCNKPEVAIAAMSSLGIQVTCACQNEPTAWHEAELDEVKQCSIEFKKDELFG